jgi:hypothetical protein
VEHGAIRAPQLDAVATVGIADDLVGVAGSSLATSASLCMD